MYYKMDRSSSDSLPRSLKGLPAPEMPPLSSGLFPCSWTILPVVRTHPLLLAFLFLPHPGTFSLLLGPPSLFLGPPPNLRTHSLSLGPGPCPQGPSILQEPFLAPGTPSLLLGPLPCCQDTFSASGILSVHFGIPSLTHGALPRPQNTLPHPGFYSLFLGPLPCSS